MVKGTDSEAVQTMKHRSRAGNNRPSLSKKSRKARKTTGAHVAKTGRPANSGDVRLSPRFRSPVDIERLGKALVAIAMRQAPEPEAGAEDDAGADTKGRDGTTGAGHDTQQ
jgi:hypothetical protein